MRKNFEVPIIGSIIGFRMSVARLGRRRTTCLTGGEPAQYPLIEACLARPRRRPRSAQPWPLAPGTALPGASRSVPCPCPLLPRREVATATRLTGPPYGPVSIGRTWRRRLPAAWHRAERDAREPVSGRQTQRRSQVRGPFNLPLTGNRGVAPALPLDRFRRHFERRSAPPSRTRSTLVCQRPASDWIVPVAHRRYV